MKRAERSSEYAAVRYRNQTSAVCAALCAALVLTACGSSEDGGGKTGPDAKSPASNPSAPSTTASPSADPEAEEKKAVTDAYARMWDEQVKAYAKADPKGTKLSTYSAALAFAQTKNDLKGLKEKGIVTTGEPTHEVKVTSIKLDKKVPSAELTDCVDTSNWKFIYRKSGKAVAMPENRLKSYVMEIQAEKWGKQWKIVVEKPTDRAC
ncbi:hypothetical protein ACFWPU_39315 [Streptomyces sp. NPDC058471]|uniref:hypothetical protein n=1 Tax=Streptomyces sp. NPDC058471 TaxID=3346516 RepID=UPI00365868C5